MQLLKCTNLDGWCPILEIKSTWYKDLRLFHIFDDFIVFFRQNGDKFYIEITNKTKRNKIHFKEAAVSCVGYLPLCAVHDAVLSKLRPCERITETLRVEHEAEHA